MQLRAEQTSRQQRQQEGEKAAYPTVTAEMIEDRKISQMDNLRKNTAEMTDSTSTSNNGWQAEPAG
jgi:hypothetical protein